MALYIGPSNFPIKITEPKEERIILTVTYNWLDNKTNAVCQFILEISRSHCS